MDNKKTDFYYVEKIMTDLAFVINHTEGLTLEELKLNEVLVDSVMFRLIQISENASKLTQNFKLQYPHIPWHSMKALRNRIVHEYGSVDLVVVYKTVKEDIPNLLSLMKTYVELFNNSL